MVRYFRGGRLEYGVGAFFRWHFMQRSRIGPIALEEPLGGSADSNVLRGVHVERNLRMAVKLLPRLIRRK